MLLHTKYQCSRLCGFRQEEFNHLGNFGRRQNEDHSVKLSIMLLAVVQEEISFK